MARKQMISPPEEGSKAPEFNLPGAQGGRLRLGLRTVRGPVIVVFYRGAWSGECVEYFKALAEKEREINVAGATLVGIGPVEPGEARQFVRDTGFKSYLLYDYIRETTRDYGLLRKDSEHGDTALPAVFLIGADQEVLHAWLEERPSPDHLLARVSEITGLPKEPEEEEEEKPKKRPRRSAGSAEDESGAVKEPATGDNEEPQAPPRGEPDKAEKASESGKERGSEAEPGTDRKGERAPAEDQTEQTSPETDDAGGDAASRDENS